MALEDYLPSFSWADVNSKVDPALRQRIALQLMASSARKGYPKNIGEGLSAIGDSLGQIGLARMLERSDLATQARAAATSANVQAGPATVRTAPTIPPDDTTTPQPRAEDDNPDEPDGKPLAYAQPDDSATRQPVVMAVRQATAVPATPQSTDTPMIRLNPDGTIAGNVTAPTQLPEPTDTSDNQDTKGDQVAQVDQGTTPAQRGPVPIPVPRPPGAGPGNTMLADPRTRMALALMTARGVPQQNPTLAGAIPANLQMEATPAEMQAALAAPTTPAPTAAPLGGPQQPNIQLAQNAAALPPTPSQIRPAPAATPPIAAAPQPVVPQTPAQIGRMAVPAPDFGYVPLAIAPPKPPPQTPQSDRENAAQQALINDPTNPYLARQMQQIMQEEANKRQFIDRQNQDQYMKELENYNALRDKRQELIATQAARNVAGAKAIEEYKQIADPNRLRAQFSNLPPEEVFKQLNASKANAQSAIKSLAGAQAAMEAFDKGAITGAGANQKLDVAKLFTSLGLVDKHNLIANTETFKGAMQPVVANILHSTSGMSQLSEGELAFAKSASAGNITLDPQSIRTLMGIINKASRAMVAEHQNNVDAMFGPNPSGAKALFEVKAPLVAPARGPVEVSSESEAMALPPNTRFRLHGRTGVTR